MVSIYKPETLVKIGNHRGKLEESLIKFDTDFRIIPLGVPTTLKYGLYKEAPDVYYMVISYNQLPVQKGEHNIVLTLTSDEDVINQKVYSQLLQKTGLIFRDPNPDYERLIQEMFAMIFPKIKETHGGGIQKFPSILTIVKKHY